MTINSDTIQEGRSFYLITSNPEKLDDGNEVQYSIDAASKAALNSTEVVYVVECKVVLKTRHAVELDKVG